MQKSSAKPASAYSLQRARCFSSLTQKVKLWEKHYLAKVTIFVETYPPLLSFWVSGTSRPCGWQPQYFQSNLQQFCLFQGVESNWIRECVSLVGQTEQMGVRGRLQVLTECAEPGQDLKVHASSHRERNCCRHNQKIVTSLLWLLSKYTNVANGETYADQYTEVKNASLGQIAKPKGGFATWFGKGMCLIAWG